MLTLPVNVAVMVKILNEGLVVLTPEETRPLGERNLEGESLALQEIADDSPTGRTFYARGMHDLGGGYVQVTLSAFMEDRNPETGVLERFPMAGGYANEKHVVPESAMKAMEDLNPVNWSIRVKGEKPIWLYRGIKWIGEYSIAEVKFAPDSCKVMQDGKPPVPNLIYIKVQGAGGEAVYAFELDGPA